MQDFVNREARFLPGGVLEFVRGRSPAWRAYFNLTDRPADLPGGAVLFRSEAARYGGRRAEGDPSGRLLPFECVVVGPPGWRRFG